MFRGTSNFDRLLDKATSYLLLEPDWNTTLQLCDCIRQGDVQAKYALGALKKKLSATNPHVVLYALQVLESWVKNCGVSVHQEVATKQFMEDLNNLLKLSNNEAVKSKILELIQTWAHAFRNDPNYRIMQDTLNLMKIEGHTFPVLKESDAMFSADQAPKWLDGECCHRCRVVFGMVQRKHHCRHCGQVFCGKCSNRTATIPRFGFEKEVRVCEVCFEKLNKPSATGKSESELPQEYLSSSLAQQPQMPPAKSEQELQEEEDLQLAIALSKSDAEIKEKEKLRATSAILSIKSTSPAPIVSSAPSPDSTMESNPELARYLNRTYWEQKVHTDSGKAALGGTVTVNSLEGPIPSAPTSAPLAYSQISMTSPSKIIDSHQNGELDDLDEFVVTLRSNLETFINRMRSNSSRGRSIAVDSTVQTSFLNITAMHSQLLNFIQEQEDRRVYYESLQDKLSQAKDARAALDALREDHRERLRREAEEAERQRQIQMAQKLEIMRKKKQEYLQYQRQIAMQRMQEQEREMQFRHEQQKQQYMRQMATGGFQPPMASPPPQGQVQGNFISPPQLQQGFSPAQTNNEFPIHSGGGGGGPGPSGPAPTSYQPQYFPRPASQQPFQQGPEFQSFNMQGMTTSLPISGVNFPTQQVIPAAGINQNQHQQTQAMGGIPAGGATLQQNPPANVTVQQPIAANAGQAPVILPTTMPSSLPSHVSPGPVLPRQPMEAELISFD